MDAVLWSFDAELWRAEASDAWVFVTVPPDLSDDIRIAGGPPVGFGSVRVRARLGSTMWSTSVFPDKRSGCFVLPVKRAVRRAEGLDDGDVGAFEIEVVS
ncbi:MAG: DUF1905 domain-containing protein [Nocardioidaceae bacterium]|nr:DUF1905 domain-containing protein [Nocardioidaceae bacterium]